MKTIEQWWNSHKNKNRINEVRNIRSDFKICERNGLIYLTHNGYAFATMPKHATADEIATKLNEARQAALEFEGLLNTAGTAEIQACGDMAGGYYGQPTKPRNL